MRTIRVLILIVILLSGVSSASTPWEDRVWDIDLVATGSAGAIFFEVWNPNGVDHQMFTSRDKIDHWTVFGLVYMDAAGTDGIHYKTSGGNGSALGSVDQDTAYAGFEDRGVRTPTADRRYVGPMQSSPGILPAQLNTTHLILAVYWVGKPVDATIWLRIDWNEGTTFERLRDGTASHHDTEGMAGTPRGVRVGANEAARVHVNDGYFEWPPGSDLHRLGIVNVNIPGGPAYGNLSLEWGYPGLEGAYTYHKTTTKLYQEQPLNQHAYDCVCPLWWQTVFTTDWWIDLNFDFVGYGRNADVNLIVITHPNPEVPVDFWRVRQDEPYYTPS